MRKDCEFYDTCGMELCLPEVVREGIECPEYMPKMKPMLFNTEMVRAILDNRKTATRRTVKFPEGMTGRLPENGFVDGTPYLFYPCGIKRPKYKVGDILYVRETWAVNEDLPYANYIYKADDENPLGWCAGVRWHPSIHMPKEAARIFLRVTNVKVEIAQDISETDARKEGFYTRCYFMSTFCDIYGVDIYEKTWVWVYEFERCDKPEVDVGGKSNENQ